MPRMKAVKVELVPRETWSVRFGVERCSAVMSSSAAACKAPSLPSLTSAHLMRELPASNSIVFMNCLPVLKLRRQ